MADNKIPAFEVFKASLASLFPNIDNETSWLTALYNASQKYYAMGLDESLIPDTLLTDENAPQAYKDRFKGIFDLKALKAKNPSAIIHIPSVSEYVNQSNDMSRELTARGLNNLATTDNIAKIIGQNVDFTQFKERLDTAFDAIDNADQFLKAELATSFSGVSRSDIAEALLTGEEGAKALKKKIDIAGMRAAASEFGMKNVTSAEELANMESQGLVSRASVRAGYEKTSAELAGIKESQRTFGGGGDIMAELETSNVLNKQSEEVNRLRSQARAEFSGQTGASSQALRRKRQV